MLLYCILLILLANYISAAVREIEINLSSGVIDPDCYGQGYEKLLANGQFPAPPIRVTKGDEVRVTVRNAENTNRMTTIHFHGILQLGTTEADGFPDVTQAEIPPGGVFQQNFRIIDQAGTYFYHAHSGLQENSVFGAFIVYETDYDWPSENPVQKLHEGPYEYDDELILLLSEWWHQEEKARLDWMLGNTFDAMADTAESHLLNGRTIFNASNIPENCKGYSVLDVEPGKTYRLRVVGSQTFASMNIAIENHIFTVIEVDGVLIKPYKTNYLPVTSGQRFSALLSTDQLPRNYKITVKPFNTNTMDSNGLAFLRYTQSIPVGEQDGFVNIGKLLEDLLLGPNVDAPSNSKLPGPPASSAKDTIDKSYFQSMEPLTMKHDFGAPPDRTIILTPVETRLPDNTTRWLINNRLAPEYSPPLITQLAQMDRVQLNSTAIDRNKAGLSDGYDDGHRTFPMRNGETIDIVVHSTMLHDPNICLGHPWHSHGLIHYPIANGPGEYVHERDKYIRTYPTPIAKDTTYVYQYPPPGYLPSGTPCGWMKLRFYVANPGLWGFHCHITRHMLQGLMVILEVSPEQIPILQKKQDEHKL